jgi:hypothetical protein
MLIANSMVLLWGLRLHNAGHVLFAFVIFAIFTAALQISSITALVMALNVVNDPDPDPNNWMIAVTDPDRVSCRRSCWRARTAQPLTAPHISPSPPARGASRPAQQRVLLTSMTHGATASGCTQGDMVWVAIGVGVLFSPFYLWLCLANHALYREMAMKQVRPVDSTTLYKGTYVARNPWLVDAHSDVRRVCLRCRTRKVARPRSPSRSRSSAV